MSEWRSPLLYLGIAVILAAATALIAPYFIDWNSYRSALEDYGYRLSGRNVRIGGDIKIRLFPFPVLKAGDVRIANPPGASANDLLRAKNVEIRMALAPLISGRVVVEKVIVDTPVLGLERMASGLGTWHLKAANGVAGLAGKDKIAVAGIEFRNGTVVLGDAARGGLAKLENVNAVLSAPGLAGPWRLKAQLSYQGSQRSLSVTTGKIRPGQPLALGVRIAPVETSGLVYSFDGTAGGSRDKFLQGKLRVVPATTKTGKSDSQERLRPLEYKAIISAGYDEVRFTKVEIAPQSTIDIASFLTGEAVMKFGRELRLTTKLSATRFNLDAVLGPRGSRVLASGDALYILGRMLDSLPPGLEARVDLDIANLEAGGVTLENTHFKADFSPDRIKITELAANLPGKAFLQFAGIFLPDENKPQLTGDVTFNTFSLRDFLAKLNGANSRTIQNLWSGSRGNFKSTARADITPLRLRLSNIRAGLDASRFTGDFSYTGGDVPAINVEADVDVLDVDKYFSSGVSSPALNGGKDAPGLLDMLGYSMSLGRLHLAGNVNLLIFRGVEARKVVFDLNADENSVDVRQMKIGDVGKASFDALGVLRFSDNAITGNGSLNLDAPAPLALLRLLGVVAAEGSKEPVPDWVGVLGALKLKLVANAENKNAATLVDARIAGSAGQNTGTLKLRFNGDVRKWQTGMINLSGEVRSQKSSGLVQFAGIKVAPGKGRDRAGHLTFSSSGTYQRGMATTLGGELFGLQGQYSGRIKRGPGGLEINGRLALLSERAGDVLKILGLPSSELSPARRVFSAEGEVTYRNAEFAVNGINGTAAGATFKAGLKVLASAGEPKAALKLETRRLYLPWLLDVLVMPKDGARHSISSRFAASGIEPGAFSIRVNAAEMTLAEGVVLSDGVVNLSSNGAEVRADVTGKGAGKTGFKGEFEALLMAAGARVKGQISGGIELARLLKARNGDDVLEGIAEIALTFEGTGRSPGGVISSMTGTGSYSLARGIFRKLDPKAFARDVVDVKTPADVDRIMGKSLRSGDMTFVGGKGKIAIANGVFTATPLAISGAGARGRLKIFYEPVNDLLDVSIRLKIDPLKGLDSLKSLPPFEIAYAGERGSLLGSSDVTALKNHIAVKVIKEGLAKLDALKLEEKRIIEEQKAMIKAEEERRKKEEEKRKAQQDALKKALEDQKAKEARELDEKKKKDQSGKKPKPAAAKKPLADPASAPAGLVRSAPPFKKLPVPRVKPSAAARIPALPATPSQPVRGSTAVRVTPTVIRPAPRKPAVPAWRRSVGADR